MPDSTSPEVSTPRWKPLKDNRGFPALELQLAQAIAEQIIDRHDWVGALEVAAGWAESYQHAIDHPGCGECRIARAAAANLEAKLKAAWQSAAEAQREACAVYHGGMKPLECRCEVSNTPLVACPAPEEK
jgi:hypothetical protein